MSYLLLTVDLNIIYMYMYMCFHRELATTPLLVVANKIDLEPHASEQVLIKGIIYFYVLLVIKSFVKCMFYRFSELNLDYIVDNPWIIIPCSALKTINVDEVVSWLIKQADSK